ncbi:TetR/AcrR family transcriptional regulator [Streptomyces tricolor]|uniref:TetR/AcrR family transcriptional regulator n=1 Tax=Streptomyces tricolor TaxID=68277 RepID=A0ABS9J8M6_9ACTN|nr:TetR/AcrR family transcriptional regulator [Streptomyces tricolor]MCG0061923.1 TetR/AcrR family transcriptional regulator [Streptomyces tricolor]
MPRPSVREQLVDAAAECFHERGYNGTGIQDIARTAGVPKGSVYNHFASKEALAAEVMDRYAVSRKLEMLRDKAVAPVPRLRAHFEYLASDLKQFSFERGCMFGNFGAELSNHSDAMRGKVDSGLTLWTTAVTQVLEEARAAGALMTSLTPDQLGQFLVNAWEGAVLRAKVTRSRTPLDGFFVVFDSFVA